MTYASPFVQRTEEGSGRLELAVPGMSCAACIQKIEKGIAGLHGVDKARAYLSTKRVVVEGEPVALMPDTVVEKLASLGYAAAPFDPGHADGVHGKQSAELMRCLAVSGFVSANIMLFSIAIWAGLVSDMDGATRSLFQWLSALLGLPAAVYAGLPFYRSAFEAVRKGTMNMDVPISAAVILAGGASVIEMLRGAEHVYFDSGVMLLFFLLIGRVLDERMRGRASAAARNLLALRSVAATVAGADGSRHVVPVSMLEPGMMVAVAAGMRVPADGLVRSGTSDVDVSIITGEGMPQTLEPGAKIYAGSLNLSAMLTVEVTATEDGSLLAEIARMMEAAEQGRAKFVRLADRMARIYAPAVFILAGLSAGGWLIAGSGWHEAMMIAVAVLVITCPCALGLAVPVSQVVAAGRLFEAGIFVKSGDALERLAEVDMLAFDKTGTLTEGVPALLNAGDHDPALLAEAAALARDSRHPLAQALARHIGEKTAAPAFSDIAEHPGAGLSAKIGDAPVRLGRAEFAANGAAPGDGMEMWYAKGDAPAHRFQFIDGLREDSSEVMRDLDAAGYGRILLSGDRTAAVTAVANALNFEAFKAECHPGDKIERLEALKKEGRKVLMIGDGLNDAPSLRAAHASMSPADAADIAQNAADIVFQGRMLAPVALALRIARATQRVVVQNFGLALAYNLAAVPLAVAGLVNPLIAAIAMSSSSLLVVLNALRLRKAG